MITGHSALIEGDWFSFLFQFRGPEPYKGFPILPGSIHFPELIFCFISHSCVSDDKESACSAGDPGSVHGLERFPGEGNGNPL